MKEFEIGVKIYDYDWLEKYCLSPKKAARVLKDWGVNFVLVKSDFIKKPIAEFEEKAHSDDESKNYFEIDLEFRKALAEEGIDYWITVCTFYNKKAIEKKPGLRPVGSDGLPMEKQDWYIGIAPSTDSYVQNQVEQIEFAVQKLEPDGVFLSFTRWPGFWELWMPDHKRRDFPEYCYDQSTLARFKKDTGIRVPHAEPKNAAEWIDKNVREQWTAWKCDIVADVVRKVKLACRNKMPDVEIMLNTLPFTSSNYDNAREKVFGQDIELLKENVEVFEVMTYHQILNRPVDWMPVAGIEVKTRVEKKTVCTIQAEPIYLEGMYAKDNRSPILDDNEFSAALHSIESAGLDGVVIFTWSDLLKEVYKKGNKEKVNSLSSAANHRRIRLNKTLSNLSE
ncbi:MAG: hypothetical protein JEZ06_10810 [Anaerolineaceae bacterium]|nr:hypothetical protein [Anaerolineaceae bacterium]